ncbi:MAG: NFACT family protein [Clostridia bacterium]|nr:NFACT family protein [Clostridia bacterium]
MPLSTILLSSLVRELSGRAEGARIDKINQPTAWETVLSLRTRSGNEKLLLSANPQSARAAFTEESRENPAVPPLFCMMLRKHLTGGRIVGIRQEEGERILTLEIMTSDEMGDRGGKRLIAELMGRNSNLILVGSDGRILDALKKVDSEMSEKRQVLPGLFYRLPPGQDKLPLLKADEETLLKRIGEGQGKRISDLISEEISGVAPLEAREAAFRAAGDTDALVPPAEKAGAVIREILFLRERMEKGDGTPFLLTDRETGKMRDFTFYPVGQYGNRYVLTGEKSFSALLEGYFAGRDAENALRQKTAELRKTVANLLERTDRKLALQREELLRTEGRERLREKADILGAFAYQVEKGRKSVVLPDLYAEDGGEVEIALSEKLTAQQNVRRYYKEYAKLKNAAGFLRDQIGAGEKEKAYLESVLEELDRVRGSADAAEVREELEGEKLLPVRGKKKTGPQKEKGIKPLLFRAPSGKTVLVGRNNRENDRLTLREANKTDLWFHVKNRPGSHAILLTGGAAAEDGDILFAASLAAGHSSLSGEERADVDYAPVKNVRKPAGAKPGMVIYDRYRTVTVKPFRGGEETR